MITKEQEQTRTARDRRPVTAALAAAGIAGPVFFVVVALVQGRLRSSATSEGPGVLPILTSHHALRASRAPHLLIPSSHSPPCILSRIT